jgi:hypothetical protein
MNTPKQIFEPIDVEQLLRGWLIHGHKGRDRHDIAARRCARIQFCLGGCATVFSAVAGTSVFAALSKDSPNTTVRIFVVSVAILSAILTGLGSYLNYSERADKHRLAGVRYKEAIRELERTLSMSVTSMSNTDLLVTAIKDRLDQLEETAPVVPERIYDQVEKDWKEHSFKFVEKADELYGKNARPSA